MRRGLGYRRLLVLCAGAIVVVSVGVAYAAIPHSSTGVISGCYGKTTGILRVIDAQAGKHCLSFETPISWNQKGLKGDNGDPGAPGLAGLAGASGPAGATGPGGADGEAGAAGPAGPQGPSGPEGPQGLQGDPGENGADGADGTPFDGTFTSPNGLYSLTVDNSGIELESPVTSVKLTVAGVSVQASGPVSLTGGPVLVNGGCAGVLRATDVAIVSGGPGAPILLNPGGAPNFRSC